MTKTFTCIYHFLVLNWYIFLNFYISQCRKNKESSKIFYLTLLNLVTRTGCFLWVACLDDMLKRIKGRKSIKFLTAFRDLLFTTLAFPVSAVSHKDAFAIQQTNILDSVFPVWLNHARHTSILPLSLIEVILRPHHCPSKKTGLSLLTAGSLILWLYSETGTWGYPVLANLSPLGLAAFFILSYIFSASLYLLGEKLNHWKWGRCISLLPTNAFLLCPFYTPPGNRRKI
uniref:Androgen dependent TFPI regulating protein n=1 Tax=Propithecus coquereli TaxID=379532 RepID=A0A2K6EM71_PROCO